MAGSIIWFKDLSRADASSVGEKAAYLADLFKAELPVPGGFVVLTDIFDRVRSVLKNELQSLLEQMNPADFNSINTTSQQIQKFILDYHIPEAIKSEIREAYAMLSETSEYKDVNVNQKAMDFIKAGRDPPLVAVRSSVCQPAAPYQQASFLNIKGGEDVLEHVKRCWASMFNVRALLYRVKHNVPLESISMGVIIQRTANTSKSGIIYTIDPVSGKREHIRIEAHWGFGRRDSAQINTYVVSRTDAAIVEKNEQRQTHYYTRDLQDSKTVLREVPEELQNREMLTTAELEVLSRAAITLEKRFGPPQIISWGIDRKNLVILDILPLAKVFKRPLGTVDTTAQLAGIPANPGIARGAVAKIASTEDVNNVSGNNILVVRALLSWMQSAVFKAAALVSETGGLISQSLLLAKELGKPCIIEVQQAIKLLENGKEVEVNANTGTISWQRAELPPPIEYAPEPVETASIETVGDSEVDTILAKLTELERSVVELVYKDTQLRRTDPESSGLWGSEISKSLSELEWNLRNLRDKLKTALNQQ